MTLWADRGVLDRCAELKKLGDVFALSPGAHIARGFADVGYEEFCLLPGDRLVSLFTGSITELRDDERGFFFVIPTVDDVTQELDRRGWDVVALESPDRRGWILRVRKAEGADLVEVSALTLLETCLDALIKVVAL